jgi:transposase
LFKQAVEDNHISKNIHYNAISRTLLKKEITPLLYNLVRFSARPLASVETDFAIDSSGFRCSTFGEYSNFTHGTAKTHNWLKVHICTGVKTNVVADVVITDEHGADSPQFKKLVQRTADNFQVKKVVADAAYSSSLNHEIVDRLGATAYIPFKKNATGESKDSKIWTHAFHYFQLRREEFLEHYHKRSNAETTFSAIKAKFGETIKSKNRTAQINEMLCKIIAYNITVVIREMIEIGFNYKFLSSNPLNNKK